MQTDPRGAQHIDINEEGRHLGLILDQLSQQTHIKLSTVAPMEDTVIVCRYSGTLAGFMEALANFFAADKTHTAYWSRSGAAPHWRYTLERDLVTIQLINSLRIERHNLMVQRMEAAIRAPQMTAGEWAALSKSDPALAASLQGAMQMIKQNKALQYFGTLSPAMRQKVYAGSKIQTTAAALGGAQGARGYLKDCIGPDHSYWADNTQITYYMAGPSPLNRSFSFGLVDNMQECHNNLDLPSEFSDISPEKQQEKWRAAYGDVAPKDNKSIDMWKEKPNSAPRCKLALQIAEKAQVNLITDDMGQSLYTHFFPAKGTLADLLDALCRYQGSIGDRSVSNQGSFWRKSGNTYLVRSLSWLEEEQRLIPYRWLKKWDRSEKKYGHLRLDDLVEMAGLHPQQIAQLAAWYPVQAQGVLEAQTLLRWYARETPEVRQALKSKDGVPIQWFGVTSQNLKNLQIDQDPALAVSPNYIRCLQLMDLSKVRFQVLEGEAGIPNGKRLPAVALVLQEYEDGKFVGRPSITTIPLR